MEFSSFSDSAQLGTVHGCVLDCTVPAKIHMLSKLIKNVLKNKKMFSSSLTCKQGSWHSVVV
jgi:hypothetical protein